MPKKKTTKKKVTKKRRTLKYKAAKGSPYSDRDAQIIGARLGVLERANSGELTPDLVLADAKSHSSPLHKYFDWDDTSAAVKYRRMQAGKLIRSITVEVKIANSREPMRGYLHVTNARKKNVFVSAATVVKTPSYVKQLVSEAREKIEELNRCLWLLESHMK
jgi:hypothetical protein